MSLKDLAKLVHNNHQEKDFGERFKQNYYKAVIKQHPDRVPKEDMFSPSSLYKCERELFYRVCGTPPEPSTAPTYLNGSWKAIMDSGTDRHNRIQDTLKVMEGIEWVEVEDYIKNNNLEDLQILNRYGNELLLYSEQISARFMCDGIVKMDGTYYILEIKTMGNRKWEVAGAVGDVNKEHIMQANAYSLAFNIPNVLYVYENRDNNQIHVFTRTVTDEDRRKVLDKIARIKWYKESGKIPPRTTDISLCTYCDYKYKCSQDGYTPPLCGEEDE